VRQSVSRPRRAFTLIELLAVIAIILTLPAKPAGSPVCMARGDTGPIIQGALALDRSTGAVLAHPAVRDAGAGTVEPVELPAPRR